MPGLSFDVLKWLHMLDLTSFPKVLKHDLCSGRVVAEIIARYHSDSLKPMNLDQGLLEDGRRSNWTYISECLSKLGLNTSTHTWRQAVDSLTKGVGATEKSAIFVLTQLFVFLTKKEPSQPINCDTVAPERPDVATYFRVNPNTLKQPPRRLSAISPDSEDVVDAGGQSPRIAARLKHKRDYSTHFSAVSQPLSAIIQNGYKFTLQAFAEVSEKDVQEYLETIDCNDVCDSSGQQPSVQSSELSCLTVGIRRLYGGTGKFSQRTLSYMLHSLADLPTLTFEEFVSPNNVEVSSQILFAVAFLSYLLDKVGQIVERLVFNLESDFYSFLAVTNPHFSAENSAIHNLAGILIHKVLKNTVILLRGHNLKSTRFLDVIVHMLFSCASQSLCEFERLTVSTVDPIRAYALSNSNIWGMSNDQEQFYPVLFNCFYIPCSSNQIASVSSPLCTFLSTPLTSTGTSVLPIEYIAHVLAVLFATAPKEAAIFLSNYMLNGNSFEKFDARMLNCSTKNFLAGQIITDRYDPNAIKYLARLKPTNTDKDILAALALSLSDAVKSSSQNENFSLSLSLAQGAYRMGSGGSTHSAPGMKALTGFDGLDKDISISLRTLLPGTAADSLQKISTTELEYNLTALETPSPACILQLDQEKLTFILCVCNSLKLLNLPQLLAYADFLKLIEYFSFFANYFTSFRSDRSELTSFGIANAAGSLRDCAGICVSIWTALVELLANYFLKWSSIELTSFESALTACDYTNTLSLLTVIVKATQTLQGFITGLTPKQIVTLTRSRFREKSGVRKSYSAVGVYKRLGVADNLKSFIRNILLTESIFNIKTIMRSAVSIAVNSYKIISILIDICIHVYEASGSFSSSSGNVSRNGGVRAMLRSGRRSAGIPDGTRPTGSAIAANRKSASRQKGDAEKVSFEITSADMLLQLISTGSVDASHSLVNILHDLTGTFEDIIRECKTTFTSVVTNLSAYRNDCVYDSLLAYDLADIEGYDCLLSHRMLLTDMMRASSIVRVTISGLSGARPSSIVRNLDERSRQVGDYTQDHRGSEDALLPDALAYSDVENESATANNPSNILLNKDMK